MVIMAATDDSGHHKTKTKPAPGPACPSQATPATRPRLHDFTFPTLSWGTHRLLRCSRDGAPASPTPPPQTSSPQVGKPQGAAPGASQSPRPWNLRTRRSATAAPSSVARSEDAGKASACQAHQPQPPLASPPADAIKRGFYVALSKKEIVEDFLALRCARPPRRPKKRQRAVQRQVDMLYPGLPLADVNLDSYKIEER